MADVNNYYSQTDLVRANLWPVSTGNVTDGTGGQMDSFALHAYRVINAKLAHRYGTPFDTYGASLTPPGIIEEISDMLIICYGRRVTAGHSIKTGGPRPDICSDAMDLLDALADGSMSIGTGATATLLLDSSDRGEHPIFDKLDELDQRQDSDQSTRLLDERDED